ncbi:MAG: DNA (cytosine-5-)-methyltransferase [Cytophagales bacterium CG12_big_fil_rev_8_21_14_0_65_40_12]|nr:MAG: DNA (cytosine-5-)-methyltransferase [Cytophagales bacterium CG12_big_fil_rev_8_21_14_0_65_40_12]PIW03754.1 MAG: DNA (cytosine-5-)-methyltransferase [Cytophagales bacterium CG17_big_fil_post_rev_8_21_14_2_50_40_13]
MQFNETVLIEKVLGDSFKVRILEGEENSAAAFTHYLHNHSNGVSNFFKKDALNHVKKQLSYQFPDKEINDEVADEALQYLLFNLATNVPFPAPANPKFKFIDLFAGIGGFRIAMQNLGGKCVFSSEWDKYSQKTYELNFGEVPFGDITKESTKKYIPDGFDVLCAGFPCQAFSIAGKRGGFEDTRGTLFFDVAEIINQKRPKAFFLENVKGLRNHDGGRTLSTILNVLRNDLGYFVPEPEIINAKDFGVPQNRERIFIVGFRPDLNISKFKYPKKYDVPKTVQDIIEKKEVSVKYYLSTTYLETLRKHKARHEGKGNGFGYQILEKEGVANAVVCGGMGRERNLIIDNRLTNFTPVTKITGEVNKEGIRKLTPFEWSQLQGFPKGFQLKVSDVQAYKQLGNSVAVPAIQATANEIVKTLKIL